MRVEAVFVFEVTPAGAAPQNVGLVPDVESTTDLPKGERRQWRRILADDLPKRVMAVASGADAELIDLSRRGARLRTLRRLLPNTVITLRLLSDDDQVSLTGRVIRSTLIKMSDGAVGYEAAVLFNSPVDQFLEGATRPPAA